MTTTAQLAQSTPWGDRTRLLPKAMTYALSLDIEAETIGPFLKVKSSNEKVLRHLFGDAVLVTPEGLSCDLPTGSVESGDGEIGDPNDPASVGVRLRVRTKIEPVELALHFECLGIVNFDGGPEAFRSKATKRLTGSAFVATYHQASSATYRWMERRQLYGVGRVSGHRTSGEWLLRFSFDLYAGS